MHQQKALNTQPLLGLSHCTEFHYSKATLTVQTIHGMLLLTPNCVLFYNYTFTRLHRIKGMYKVNPHNTAKQTYIKAFYWIVGTALQANCFFLCNPDNTQSRFYTNSFLSSYLQESKSVLVLLREFVYTYKSNNMYIWHQLCKNELSIRVTCMGHMCGTSLNAMIEDAKHATSMNLERFV